MLLESFEKEIDRILDIDYLILFEKILIKDVYDPGQLKELCIAAAYKVELSGKRLEGVVHMLTAYAEMVGDETSGLSKLQLLAIVYYCSKVASTNYKSRSPTQLMYS